VPRLAVLDGIQRGQPASTAYVVSPIDKAILDEITTLDLALTEHLSVGKPDALGLCTLVR